MARLWRKYLGIRPNRQLRELYWFTGLFSFATALATIFEPVFFYQEGFSLSLIGVYYGLHYLAYFFLLPLGGKFASRFGLERSLVVSLPLFIAYFIVLAVLPQRPNLFWVAWALLAVFKIFYWPAYYAMFSRYGTSGNLGTQVSFDFALKLGIGVAGPLIGGFTAAIFGFPVLFIVTAILALGAAVPLLRTKEQFTPRSFLYKEPWRIMLSRRHRGMAVSTFGWVEDLVSLVFWPVFAFIVLGGTAELGVVTSISVLIMSALAFWIGEAADRRGAKALLQRTSWWLMGAQVLRVFAVTPLWIFVSSAAARGAEMGVKVPWLSRFYGLASKEGALRYGIAFEMILSFAKGAAAFALAAVFAMTLPYTGFVAAFLTAGAFAWLYRKL